MSDLISQITADLKSQIESFQPELEVRDVGSVIEAGDDRPEDRHRERHVIEVAAGDVGVVGEQDEHFASFSGPVEIARRMIPVNSRMLQRGGTSKGL